MPDKKLTDAEIVKALECCAKFDKTCDTDICDEDCPYHGKFGG